VTEVLQDLSDALAATVKTAGSSVVQVEARRRLPASGIIWSSDGVIVTAYHAVERDENISVGLPNGQSVPATLIGRDPTTDLAVLRAQVPTTSGAQVPTTSGAQVPTTSGAQVPTTSGAQVPTTSGAKTAGLTQPTLADLDNLHVGHLVLALGRPGRTAQATLGIVSALGESWRTPAGGRIDRYLQTDVVMYPGFSGGPLVNAAGQVLGLNTSALLRGISLTVPTSTLSQVVQTLLTHGHVRRGYLGVGAQPVRLPSELGQQLGQETGLLLASVEPGSPADQGGLLLGDTIVALDGQPVRHMDDLLALLSSDRVGETLPVRIVRGGQVQELKVVVGERT
jgi:S1-C subfamily serine protease